MSREKDADRGRETGDRRREAGKAEDESGGRGRGRCAWRVLDLILQGSESTLTGFETLSEFSRSRRSENAKLPSALVLEGKIDSYRMTGSRLSKNPKTVIRQQSDTVAAMTTEKKLADSPGFFPARGGQMTGCSEDTPYWG